MTKEKVVCYYHNDMDGIASASIVKKVYPDAQFTAVDYSDNLEMSSDDITIIVDFSFPKETMEYFIKNSGKVIWIDHHKTAKEQNSKLWDSNNIEGLRSTNKSGCELTWQWFFPHDDVPRSIELIGDRDMWIFKYGIKTKAFHEVVSLQFEEPDTNLVTNSPLEIESFIRQGMILLDKKQKQVKKSFEQGIETTFEGHITKVINTNFNVSETGEYCYKNHGYPVALMWSVREGKVICSLRSNTIDVGELAKQLGGGGHKFAAGFETKLDFIKDLYAEVKDESH